MTAETCEHCGLTPKSDWPIACRYASTLRPEIREGWRRSGADAPCACDAFDEEQAELQASAIRRIAATFAALIGFVALTWFSLRG